MAQLAHMSTAEYEDFYFKACLVDYDKMNNAIEPLKKLMDRTDKVHITGPKTDITFSIKNIGSYAFCGHCNIPDGELATAPVKDSVNGVIYYNIESPYDGEVFRDAMLEFKDGKIVNATSNLPERMNKIFDTDEGARYIGEFAIGFNPYIKKPILDILFDEKMAGSFHFTPGNCYDFSDNGNHSAQHWDLISCQMPEWGGGEIWFDNELIRKDGLFVPEYLQQINPENLG
jgi:aminopeptidase